VYQIYSLVTRDHDSTKFEVSTAFRFSGFQANHRHGLQRVIAPKCSWHTPTSPVGH